MKVSIVIANYNNAQFIEKCVNSIKNQTYKNYEIIFFDDNSKDDSLKIIKQFKKIKIIENKSQTKFGSLNQINAFYKSIKKSKGKIIFFLDSDDYFHKKKLEEMVKIFKNKKNIDIICDYPVLHTKNKFIKLKKKISNFNYWGYIHPTSTIAVRKKFIENLKKIITLKKYTNIWFDLRILLISKFIFNNFFSLNKNLTFYRVTENNISSKFKKFSKNWWKRRSEAHDYLFHLSKKYKFKLKKNFDYALTKFLNYLF